MPATLCGTTAMATVSRTPASRASATVRLTWAGVAGQLATADDLTDTATTDATGAYSIGALPAGIFSIDVDPATIRGYQATTGTPRTFSLAAGETRPEIDLGY